MAASAGKFRKTDYRKTVEIDIPEIGDKVKVREMSIADRAYFADNGILERTVHVDGKQTTIRTAKVDSAAYVCVRCLIDDDGNRLYGDDELDELKKHSQSVLERLSAAALELSTPASVGELEKNSAAAPSGDSSSA